MKKIILIFCIFSLLIIFNYQNISGQEINNITENTESVYSIKPTNLISIDENIFIYQINDKCYLKIQDNDIYLEQGLLKSAITIDSQILILLSTKNNSFIYIYDLNKKTLTNKKYEEVILNKISIINDNIYLVGHLNEDALIYVLDKKLNTIKQKIFEGDAFEEVLEILYHDNYFYVTIYKDALSNNSLFVSSGNTDERKSIITKLDENLNIIDVIYFNEHSANELITSFMINDDIEILLKAENNYFYYKLDFDLTIIDYQKLSNYYDEYYLINNYHQGIDYLLLATFQNNIVLLGKQNNLNNQEVGLKELYFLKNLGDILNYNIYLGNLYVYLNVYSGLKIITLNHFDIIKNEPIIINYLNSQFKLKDHLIIESYFEEFNINENKITSSYYPNISGTYDINYEIERSSGKTIDINIKIIVEPYTNFVNGGIYPLNKKLEFFGYATCNGQTIYNGEELNHPGCYEIIITNSNNQQTIYNIYIIDNYNTDEIVNNIPCEIYSLSNEFILELNFDKPIDIVDIVINNNIYDIYEVNNNNLLITLKLNNGANSFCLNKINYVLNNEIKSIEINKTIDILRASAIDNITLTKDLTKEYLKLDLKFNDNNQTFKYFKVIEGEDEKIIRNNQNLSLSGNIQIYYVYCNGLNYNEKLILEYDVTDLINIDFNFEYDNESIKNTIIIINNPKDFSKINKIITNDIDLTNYFSEYQRHSFLPTIIYISLGIILIFIIVLVIKIIYNKSKNNKFS